MTMQAEKQNEETPETLTANNNDDFDEILELAGSQGKFQKILVFFVLGPIIMVQPIFTMNALFMLHIPEHHCFVPGRSADMDLDTWMNQTIPMEIGPDNLPHYSKCMMYGPNGSSVECTAGWEYDLKDYDVTIPSEFNWVCSKETYATDALTLYAVGNCIGALIFGWAADKYGRRPLFFLTVFINTFFRGVSLFVPHNFPAFLGLQFLIGTAFPVMYITPSLIAAEVSDKEYRGFIYAFTWVIWVAGMAALPLIAYLARNWLTIGLITSAPGILLFFYWKMLPESPRWLIGQGRVEDAAVILLRIAKQNGREDKLPESLLESLLKKVLIKQEQSLQQNVGAWTLFSRSGLARNTIMLTISWSMNALLYYAITLNADNMSGNTFLNFFILAIIEVPAGWLGGYLVDRTGRRWTQVAFFLAAVAAFIVAALVVYIPDLSAVLLASIVVAKFCITLTFLVVYLQGAEIFPTQLRTTGSGMASTVASAVGVCTPYIVFLSKINLSLPYLILAALGVVGLIASMILPETLHASLPESVEDADSLGKPAAFWSYLPHQRPETSKPETNETKSA